MLSNAVLVAAVWSFVVVTLRVDRAEVIDAAVQRNDGLVMAVEQYAIRTIETSDTVIRFLVHEYSRYGHRTNFDRLVTGSAVNFEAITGVMLADERGDAIFAANAMGPFKAVNIADRDHFRAHVERDSGSLVVGKPVVGRVSGKLLVPMTRRINKLDGAFGGVAMAPIEPSRFTDILERSEMLPLDVISVVGHDGIERARLRDGITVSGDDVRNSALFVQALRSATGNMRTDAQADGVPRYYSYRTIPGYGLVAAVGRAESDVMAEFVQRQRRYLAAAAIATVLIVGFAVLFLMALAGQRRGSATGLRNQARFMAAFDQAAVGISHSDPSGRYIEVNQRFCDILGYTEAELLAGNVGDIVGFAGDWPEGSDRERRLLATGARKALDWEKRCIRKDGSAVWCAITVSAVRDDQGRIEYFLSVVHDISPRKQAEEEFRAHGARLQRLSRQLMHAQEGERRRLGRELHDRIGANLSASVLSLEVLRANAGAQRAGSAARIDDCVQLLRETIAQVRDVLANLRPPALDEIGLVAAIAFHCRTVARRANLEIDVEGAEPSPRLPPETEISLFRIAQEALTNAVKHARATRITVRVTQQAGDVTLSIADNGQGFDADIGQSLSVSSLGLLTMRERAEAVNGTLVADSPPGGGARVIVVVARAPEPALASV